MTGQRRDGTVCPCDSRLIKQVETLEVEVCTDPQCAKVYAICTHPSEQNIWHGDPQVDDDLDGSPRVLLCGFCGADVT
jgi:hypothetical protein